MKLQLMTLLFGTLLLNTVHADSTKDQKIIDLQGQVISLQDELREYFDLFSEGQKAKTICYRTREACDQAVTNARALSGEKVSVTSNCKRKSPVHRSDNCFNHNFHQRTTIRIFK